MSNQEKTSTLRKLVDPVGNLYLFEVPLGSDIDIDDAEDVYQCAKDGLCWMVGYKLDGDVWRDLHNQPAGKDACKWTPNFYRKLLIDPERMDEFGPTMQELIERSRNKSAWYAEHGEKLNKIRVKLTWKDKLVQYNVGGGAYVEWEVSCAECKTPIQGKYRIQVNDTKTEVTRTQGFVSNDPLAKRRYGTSEYFCPAHAHLADKPREEVQQMQEQKPSRLPVSDKDQLTNFAPWDTSVETVIRRLKAVSGVSTQTELLPAVGISSNTIHYAKVKNRFTERVITRMAIALGLNPQWVETGLGHPVHGVTEEFSPPVPVIEVEEGPVPPEELPKETPETETAETPRMRLVEGSSNVFDEILKMAKDSETNGDFFKGFVYGVLTAQRSAA